jgi:glycosyltransferase involved in cell wall biosynthesis
MLNKITVVFQVKNEEGQIKDAVKSAQLLTKSVVVMDMKSSDQTAKRARSAGAKIISIPTSEYVEPVRNLAFSKTNSKWVLILDADERLTEQLASEIKKAISSPSPITHYAIARLNIFNNRPFYHGGWWPDYQTRLIKKSAFINWPKNIHSTVKVDGQAGVLKHYFLHYFHGDLQQMVKKTIKFENIESSLLFNAGRKVTVGTFFRKYLGELYRRLFKYQGWRDGAYGIIEGLYQAYSKTITWLLLYEKKLPMKKL